MNFTGNRVFDFLILIAIYGLCFWLAWWFLGVCALPAPFDKVARVVLAGAAVVLLIRELLGLGKAKS